MSIRVHHTTDAAVADEAVGSFLHQDPVRHNVMCTLVSDRRRTTQPIRFWWAERSGRVCGALFQSPDTFPVLVSTLADEAIGPLAGALAETADPPILGLNGSAVDSSRLAGAYATAARRPGRPVEAMRIYEIEQLAMPQPVRGHRRRAAEDDLDTVVEWLAGFDSETGVDTARPEPDANRTRGQGFVESGRLHLWESDGVPVAATVVSTAEAGVVRVGFVYTPLSLRGQGYASALVAEVSDEVLRGGHRCILYTQMTNPTSNSIYQRLGYRPVDEQVRYTFD